MYKNKNNIRCIICSEEINIKTQIHKCKYRDTVIKIRIKKENYKNN